MVFVGTGRVRARRVLRRGGYFIAISEYCQASGIAAPITTLRAWSVRSRYANDGTPAGVASALEAVPETAETLFFVAEALTRHGNSKRRYHYWNVRSKEKRDRIGGLASGCVGITGTLRSRT